MTFFQDSCTLFAYFINTVYTYVMHKLGGSIIYANYTVTFLIYNLEALTLDFRYNAICTGA